jgi:ATP-binding cassette subfamily G (WHITE) protein 2 (SNQ2)
MYSTYVFSIAQLLAEMPYSVLCATAFFLLFCASLFTSLSFTFPSLKLLRTFCAAFLDFPMGFNMSPSRAGYHFFMVLVTEIYSVTLGQAVAALSPTIMVAALFSRFPALLFPTLHRI